MKKFLKILKYFFISVLTVFIVGTLILYISKSSKSKKNFALLGEAAPTHSQDGISFRDLNKNGKLDIYENPNANIEDRADDLISRMNLEEKAGSMFINMIGTTPDGEPMEKPVLSTNPINLMMSF